MPVARGLILCLAIVWPHTVHGTSQDKPAIQLNGTVELKQLVDFASARLGLNLQYDEQDLRGTFTLRLGGPISDDDLWALTNRLLAAKGLTTVRMSGEAETLTVVKIEDAAAVTGISLPDQDVPPGFASAVIQPQFMQAAALKLALDPLFTDKTGGVTRLGETDMLLIQSLTNRLDEVLALIDQLDQPSTPPVLDIIPVTHLPPQELAALVTAAATARDRLSRGKLRGSVTPLTASEAILVVAPPSEADIWRKLVKDLDLRQELNTHNYAPSTVTLDALRNLVEQAGRMAGPGGSGDRWRMVQDDLTGTLMVSGTPAEHERIEAIVANLDALPPESRRPVRTFVIRNRSVHEILEVLHDLITGGALRAQQNDSIRADRTQDMVQPEESVRAGAEITPLPPPVESMLPSGKRRSDVVRGTSNRDASRNQRRSVPSGPGDLGVSLTADDGTNTIIAFGDARLLAQIEQLIAVLDVRQAQVMIDVVVASLTEAQTQNLGAELAKIEVSGSTLIRLTSLFGLGTDASIQSLPGAGGGFSGVVLSPGDFSVVIRALETLTNGASVTLPRVLVNNNDTATLDSVLQQPFTSTNAAETISTTSFGGFEDAGTSITITPQIAEGDHLIVEYAVTISSFVGDSGDPNVPPPRQQNTLASRVTVPDGYTVVVGGLQLHSENDGRSQVPLLGDLPIIGEVFGNTSTSVNRSKFFVFLRSNIMRHGEFEDLKYISDEAARSADIDDGWPDVQPQLIR